MVILTSAYIALLLSADNKVLRDPTRPLILQQEQGSLSEPGLSSLRVSAIFVAEGRRYAIVNQRIVHVGDKLGNFVVTAIEAGAVHFDEQGQTRVVTLNNTKVKDKADEF